MPSTVDLSLFSSHGTNFTGVDLYVQVTVEEFTMESERSHGKMLYTKLTILQRMSDDVYLGELFSDRDYTQGQTPKGTMCKYVCPSGVWSCSMFDCISTPQTQEVQQLKGDRKEEIEIEFDILILCCTSSILAPLLW